MALRALLRRQHEVSADAPSQEGAQRCFERRWRRGTGAASTPCLGRMAVWIAPNRGSPRAWASAPSCGGGASSQPTLPASKAPRAALRRAGGAARAQMARLAQAERRLRSPPIGEARGRGPPRPAAAAARALSRRSPPASSANSLFDNFSFAPMMWKSNTQSGSFHPSQKSTFLEESWSGRSSHARAHSASVSRRAPPAPWYAHSRHHHPHICYGQ